MPSQVKVIRFGYNSPLKTVFYAQVSESGCQTTVFPDHQIHSVMGFFTLCGSGPVHSNHTEYAKELDGAQPYRDQYNQATQQICPYSIAVVF